MIRVRPSILDDAKSLAPRLRTADLREIEACLGKHPLIVLEQGIEISDPCYTIVGEESAPLAIFGVVPDTANPGVGRVWMLASTELLRHRFWFLRNSRKWVELLQQQYKVLWNFIDARNEVHIEWLRWCNFNFINRVEEHGHERRPFYEFEKVAYSGRENEKGGM